MATVYITCVPHTVRQRALNSAASRLEKGALIPFCENEAHSSLGQTASALRHCNTVNTTGKSLGDMFTHIVTAGKCAQGPDEGSI